MLNVSAVSERDDRHDHGQLQTELCFITARVRIASVRISQSELVKLLCGLHLLQAKVTTELSQLLEEEEKQWVESLHMTEYQISLAENVIQVHLTCAFSTDVSDTIVCQLLTIRVYFECVFFKKKGKIRKYL